MSLPSIFSQKPSILTLPLFFFFTLIAEGNRSFGDLMSFTIARASDYRKAKAASAT